jgi:hypothetical protein
VKETVPRFVAPSWLNGRNDVGSETAAAVNVKDRQTLVPEGHSGFTTP